MHIHVYVNYFSMSLSIFNVENLCSSSLYTFYCQHICNNNTNIIINHNKLHYSPKHGIFIFHFYFLSHGNAFGKSYYSYIQIIKTCGQIAATLPKHFMTVILKLWHQGIIKHFKPNDSSHLLFMMSDVWRNFHALFTFQAIDFKI